MDDYIEPTDVEHDLGVILAALDVPDNCPAASRFRRRFTLDRVRRYVIEAHERQLLEDRIDELEKELRMTKDHHRTIMMIFTDAKKVVAAAAELRRYRCLPNARH